MDYAEEIQNISKYYISKAVNVNKLTIYPGFTAGEQRDSAREVQQSNKNRLKG